MLVVIVVNVAVGTYRVLVQVKKTKSQWPEEELLNIAPKVTKRTVLLLSVFVDYVHSPTIFF